MTISFCMTTSHDEENKMKIKLCETEMISFFAGDHIFGCWCNVMGTVHIFRLLLYQCTSSALIFFIKFHLKNMLHLFPFDVGSEILFFFFPQAGYIVTATVIMLYHNFELYSKYVHDLLFQSTHGNSKVSFKCSTRIFFTHNSFVNVSL